MWWSKEVVRVSSSRRWRRHCTGNILLASLFPSFGDTFPVMQTVDVNNNLARRRIRIHTGYGITQDPQDPAPQVFLLLNSILLFTEGKRYAFTSPQQILYFVANCWMDWPNGKIWVVQTESKSVKSLQLNVDMIKAQIWFVFVHDGIKIPSDFSRTLVLQGWVSSVGSGRFFPHALS